MLAAASAFDFADLDLVSLIEQAVLSLHTQQDRQAADIDSQLPQGIDHMLCGRANASCSK
jgi:hypothetical protein